MCTAQVLEHFLALQCHVISQCDTHRMHLNTQLVPILLPPFTYEGLPIEQVQIFKHLGITLHANRGMSCAVEHLCNTARRALFGIYGRCQELNVRDPAVKCMIFDALVRPI